MKKRTKKAQHKKLIHVEYKNNNYEKTLWTMIITVIRQTT